MCAKKMTMIAILLVLVLASALAWPSANATATTEVKEEPVAEVVEDKAQKNSLKQAENLQTAVSAVQGALSSKKLTKEDKANLETALTDVETGINAMSEAYQSFSKVHLALVPTVGYTVGKDIKQAFDIGFDLIANYKNIYASAGLMKPMNFEDFKSTFTSFNGLRVAIGCGINLF